MGSQTLFKPPLNQKLLPPASDALARIYTVEFGPRVRKLDRILRITILCSVGLLVVWSIIISCKGYVGLFWKILALSVDSTMQITFSKTYQSVLVDGAIFMYVLWRMHLREGREAVR